MHLGGLARRGVDAGADRPDGLVGEHALADQRDVEAGQAGAQLSFDRREGQPLPPLLGGLADAQDGRAGRAAARRPPCG